MLATRSRHKKSLTRTEKSLLENQRSLKSQESLENQENPNNSTTMEDLEAEEVAAEEVAEEMVPTEDLLAASMTQPPVQEIPKDRATTRKAREKSVPAKTGPGSIRMPQAKL
jgi:hypothetical protein